MKLALYMNGKRFVETEFKSEKDLAKKSGVSQENISKIENGQRSIGEKVAKKLAKALKIDFELLCKI